MPINKVGQRGSVYLGTHGHSIILNEDQKKKLMKNPGQFEHQQNSEEDSPAMPPAKAQNYAESGEQQTNVNVN